jgi:hypothetical protein
MTLNASRYFSNAIVGTPQVGADINILEVHATPRFAVGFGFTRSDGNKYRYGYANAGVAAGLVVAPTMASSGLTKTDNSVITPTSAVPVAGDAVLPGRIGSRYLEVTTASKAAGQFAGGYLLIEDGSGRSYTYRIKNNTATGNPASGTIRIELYEALKANLSADTDIIIAPNPWNDVVAADTATNFMSAGVSCATTTSSLPYGWFCTKGQTGVLQYGAITAGNSVCLAASPATSGSVETWGGAHTTLANVLGRRAIGYCTVTGDSTEFCTVDLCLE